MSQARAGEPGIQIRRFVHNRSHPVAFGMLNNETRTTLRKRSTCGVVAKAIALNHLIGRAFEQELSVPDKSDLVGEPFEIGEAVR